MKSLSLFLILIYSTSLTAKAEDSIQLSKGTPAPFSGFLLPREKVESLRKMEIEHREYKLSNESYARSIKLYKENETFSDDQNKKLMERMDATSKELANARTTSTLETTGYFVLGIVTAIAATWAAKQATK